MIAHTPGPWTVTQPGNRPWYRIGGKPYFGVSDSSLSLVALTRANDTKHDGLANARLIAAAPEMLELLQGAWCCLQGLAERDEEVAALAAGNSAALYRKFYRTKILALLSRLEV